MDVALSFLPRDRAYTARVWRDGAAEGKWRPARRETTRVRATDRLSLTMEAAGGFVAILDPAGPSRRRIGPVGSSTGDVRR
jgi:hypothetical protein